MNLGSQELPAAIHNGEMGSFTFEDDLVDRLYVGTLIQRSPLTDRELEVVVRLGMYGWSRSETALDMGITPERVRQLREAAYSKIRIQSAYNGTEREV